MAGDICGWQAAVNILKCMLGLGLLSLPYATKHVGWLPMVLGAPVVAWMTSRSILFAVRAKEAFLELEASRESAKILDAQESDEAPNDSLENDRYSTGLGSFDRVAREVLGPGGQAFCALCLIVCQVSTAVAYVTILVPGVAELTGSRGSSGERWAEMITIGLMLTGLSTVKTLKEVAGIALAGLLTYLFILGALLSDCWGEHIAETVSMGTASRDGFATWFGITIFAFGSFPIAVPVYDEMINPADFPLVINWSYVFVTYFYVSFSVIGYLRYGSETKDVILFNFPLDSWLRRGSLLCFCMVLTFTYVLQMAPIYHCAERFLGRRAHYVFVRAVLVACTLAFAHFVPKTSDLVGIVGAMAASISSLLLPPIVFLRICQPSWKEYPTAVAVSTLGLFCAVQILFSNVHPSAA